jgi:hypothetical protein
MVIRFINSYLNTGVSASGYLFVANRREQLFASGTLCTDTKRGLFFWGLDGAASHCNRRFYVATAGGRTRKFRRAPCDPRAE